MKACEYSDEIIKKLERIQCAYRRIDELQQKGSVRTPEEKDNEECIHQGLHEIIGMLEREDGAAKRDNPRADAPTEGIRPLT